jgi:hypothetical protein
VLWTQFTRKQHAIELLQPHVYNDVIWNLSSSLEYEFGCRVDAGVTLQPANHVIKNDCSSSDQFIVQLEGNNEWTLEREHSDLSGDDVNDKKATTVKSHSLQPGDSLYVPAGWTMAIANQTTDSSLFLRLKTYNSNTVGNFLKLVVPQAIENLCGEFKNFRRLLPPDVRSHLGVSVSENDSDTKRLTLMEDISKLLTQVVSQTMDIVDPAHDQVRPVTIHFHFRLSLSCCLTLLCCCCTTVQMSKNFIMERLPPVLTAAEEAKTAAGAPQATMYTYTQLRIVRPGIAIAVVEDGKIVVYHAMDNSREMFETPLNPLEFDLDDGPAIEALLNAYPEAVVISELEHSSEDVEDKVGIAEALYKEGILMIVDEASKPAGDTNSDDDSDCPF